MAMNQRYIEYHQIIDLMIRGTLSEELITEFTEHQKNCATCQRDVKLRKAFVRAIKEEFSDFSDRSAHWKIPCVRRDLE